jgi:hypothetical protein
MIKTVFPVNVLIKDHNLPEEFTNELSAAVQAIFQSLMVERGLSRDDVTNEEFPVFTEENMTAFPVLKQLQSLFVDGFYELASSFEENTLTREMVEKMVSANVGKLPLMKKGDYKRVHGHTNAIAFAVFYLTDVDNTRHGGQLILKDPSFHSNFSFHPPEDFAIDTKKNRLVIAPAYVWHEVTPYLGDEDRITVVINLHLDTL